MLVVEIIYIKTCFYLQSSGGGAVVVVTIAGVVALPSSCLTAAKGKGSKKEGESMVFYNTPLGPPGAFL